MGFLRPTLTLGIVCVCATNVAGQVKAKTDPATQQLLRLEDGWAAALIARDGATFQRLLAPGFVYTEDDKTVGRDQVLHDVVSPSDSVIAARKAGMQVHLFGATGVVTGWLEVKVISSGKPVQHRYRFTDTWVRRNGDWQIVAAQDYLVPSKR